MIVLALHFLYIGLFSIGGGLSAISLIQAEIVDKLGWLTAETLVDLMAIAEMTPGPIAVNAASFVGMSLYGISGAVTATCACILPGCLISFLISRTNDRLRKNARWQYTLKALRAAVTGVIVNGGLVIVKNALHSGGSGLIFLSAALFCGGLIAYRRWKPSPMLFMLAMGTACGIVRLVLPRLLAG
nr:chromate transporter [uncultured Oscillibacter sp.]